MKMLKDDALGARLNAVKQGKEIPPPPPEDVFLKPQKPEEVNVDQYVQQPGLILFSEIFKTVENIGMSILFGLGIRAIFNTDWNFWGYFGVGILFTQAINLINRLKLFKD